MATINTVVLKGNLTRDAELKRVGTSGIALTKLGLAINHYSKPKPGEQKPEAEVCFVDIVCWGDQAERVASIRKGEGVIVHGRLKMESWQDKTSGKTITKHVVQAQTVEAVKRLQMSVSDAHEAQQQPINQPVGNQPINNNQTNMPFGGNNNQNNNNPYSAKASKDTQGGYGY